MKQLQPTDIWIFLCSVLAICHGYNGVRSCVMGASPRWDARTPTVVQNEPNPKHIPDLSCISTNLNIFDIMRETSDHGRGKHCIVTFYHHEDNKYIKLGSIVVDKHAFNKILMKYDNWLLTRGRIDTNVRNKESQDHISSNLNINSNLYPGRINLDWNGIDNANSYKTFSCGAMNNAGENLVNIKPIFNGYEVFIPEDKKQIHTNIDADNKYANIKYAVTDEGAVKKVTTEPNKVKRIDDNVIKINQIDTPTVHLVNDLKTEVIDLLMNGNIDEFCFEYKKPIETDSNTEHVHIGHTNPYAPFTYDNKLVNYDDYTSNQNYKIYTPTNNKNDKYYNFNLNKPNLKYNYVLDTIDPDTFNNRLPITNIFDITETINQRMPHHLKNNNNFQNKNAANQQYTTLPCSYQKSSPITSVSYSPKLPSNPESHHQKPSISRIQTPSFSPLTTEVNSTPLHQTEKEPIVLPFASSKTMPLVYATPDKSALTDSLPNCSQTSPGKYSNKSAVSYAVTTSPLTPLETLKSSERLSAPYTYTATPLSPSLKTRIYQPLNETMQSSTYNIQNSSPLSTTDTDHPYIEFFPINKTLETDFSPPITFSFPLHLPEIPSLPVGENPKENPNTQHIHIARGNSINVPLFEPSISSQAPYTPSYVPCTRLTESIKNKTTLASHTLYNIPHKSIQNWFIPSIPITSPLQIAPDLYTIKQETSSPIPEESIPVTAVPRSSIQPLTLSPSVENTLWPYPSHSRGYPISNVQMPSTSTLTETLVPASSTFSTFLPHNALSLIEKAAHPLSSPTLNTVKPVAIPSMPVSPALPLLPLALTSTPSWSWPDKSITTAPMFGQTFTFALSPIANNENKAYIRPTPLKQFVSRLQPVPANELPVSALKDQLSVSPISTARLSASIPYTTTHVPDQATTLPISSISPNTFDFTPLSKTPSTICSSSFIKPISPLSTYTPLITNPYAELTTSISCLDPQLSYISPLTQTEEPQAPFIRIYSGIPCPASSPKTSMNLKPLKSSYILSEELSKPSYISPLITNLPTIAYTSTSRSKPISSSIPLITPSNSNKILQSISPLNTSVPLFTSTVTPGMKPLTGVSISNSVALLPEIYRIQFQSKTALPLSAAKSVYNSPCRTLSTSVLNLLKNSVSNSSTKIPCQEQFCTPTALSLPIKLISTLSPLPTTTFQQSNNLNLVSTSPIAKPIKFVGLAPDITTPIPAVSSYPINSPTLPCTDSSSLISDTNAILLKTPPPCLAFSASTNISGVPKLVSPLQLHKVTSDIPVTYLPSSLNQRISSGIPTYSPYQPVLHSSLYSSLSSPLSSTLGTSLLKQSSAYMSPVTSNHISPTAISDVYLSPSIVPLVPVSDRIAPSWSSISNAPLEILPELTKNSFISQDLPSNTPASITTITKAAPIAPQVSTLVSPVVPINVSPLSLLPINISPIPAATLPAYKSPSSLLASEAKPVFIETSPLTPLLISPLQPVPKEVSSSILSPPITPCKYSPISWSSLTSPIFPLSSTKYTVSNTMNPTSPLSPIASTYTLPVYTVSDSLSNVISAPFNTISNLTPISKSVSISKHLPLLLSSLTSINALPATPVSKFINSIPLKPPEGQSWPYSSVPSPSTKIISSLQPSDINKITLTSPIPQLSSWQRSIPIRTLTASLNSTLAYTPIISQLQPCESSKITSPLLLMPKPSSLLSSAPITSPLQPSETIPLARTLPTSPCLKPKLLLPMSNLQQLQLNSTQSKLIRNLPNIEPKSPLSISNLQPSESIQLTNTPIFTTLLPIPTIPSVPSVSKIFTSPPSNTQSASLFLQTPIISPLQPTVSEKLFLKSTPSPRLELHIPSLLSTTQVSPLQPGETNNLLVSPLSNSAVPCLSSPQAIKALSLKAVPALSPIKSPVTTLKSLIPISASPIEQSTVSYSPDLLSKISAPLSSLPYSLISVPMTSVSSHNIAPCVQSKLYTSSSANPVLKNLNTQTCSSFIPLATPTSNLFQLPQSTNFLTSIPQFLPLSTLNKKSASILSSSPVSPITTSINVKPVPLLPSSLSTPTFSPISVTPLAVNDNPLPSSVIRNTPLIAVPKNYIPIKDFIPSKTLPLEQMPYSKLVSAQSPPDTTIDSVSITPSISNSLPQTICPVHSSTLSSISSAPITPLAHAIKTSFASYLPASEVPFKSCPLLTSLHTHKTYVSPPSSSQIRSSYTPVKHGSIQPFFIPEPSFNTPLLKRLPTVCSSTIISPLPKITSIEYSDLSQTLPSLTSISNIQNTASLSQKDFDSVSSTVTKSLPQYRLPQTPISSMIIQTPSLVTELVNDTLSPLAEKNPSCPLTTAKYVTPISPLSTKYATVVQSFKTVPTSSPLLISPYQPSPVYPIDKKSTTLSLLSPIYHKPSIISLYQPEPKYASAILSTPANNVPLASPCHPKTVVSSYQLKPVYPADTILSNVLSPKSYKLSITSPNQPLPGYPTDMEATKLSNVVSLTPSVYQKPLIFPDQPIPTYLDDAKLSTSSNFISPVYQKPSVSPYQPSPLYTNAELTAPANILSILSPMSQKPLYISPYQPTPKYPMDDELKTSNLLSPISPSIITPLQLYPASQLNPKPLISPIQPSPMYPADKPITSSKISSLMYKPLLVSPYQREPVYSSNNKLLKSNTQSYVSPSYKSAFISPYQPFPINPLDTKETKLLNMLSTTPAYHNLSPYQPSPMYPTDTKSTSNFISPVCQKLLIPYPAPIYSMNRITSSNLLSPIKLISSFKSSPSISNRFISVNNHKNPYICPPRQSFSSVPVIYGSYSNPISPLRQITTNFNNLPCNYQPNIAQNTIDINENSLKTNILNYIGKTDAIKSNTNLSIPIGNIIIAKKDCINPTIQSINPSIKLKMWPSNIKLIEAKLELKLKDLSVNNFQPIVNTVNKYDLKEIELLVQNYIKSIYGDVIIVHSNNSLNNEYEIIKSCNSIDKCNLLWPADQQL